MTDMMDNNTERTKRPYHRRTPEEIAFDKALKEQRAIERARKKAEKEGLEFTRPSKTIHVDDEEEKKDEVLVITKKKPGRKPKAAADTAPEKEAVIEKKPKKEAKVKDDDGESSNGKKPIVPKKGQWSKSSGTISMEKMYIEIQLTEPALGTSPGSKELLSKWIASKAPDAKSMEEEIAQFGPDEVEQQQMTVFRRGYFRLSDNGYHDIDILDRNDGGNLKIDKDVDVRKPMYFNYQLRGFFKDSCGLLSRAGYGESNKLKAFKKVIDGGIFVSPRRIAINVPEEYYDDEKFEVVKLDGDKFRINQRSLRTSGPSGERTALAASEEIPVGSSLKFCISFVDPKNRDAIYEWLNYGSIHGLGAWRNSGLGTFIWRELNEDWSPIEDDEDSEE